MTWITVQKAAEAHVHFLHFLHVSRKIELKLYRKFFLILFSVWSERGSLPLVKSIFLIDFHHALMIIKNELQICWYNRETFVSLIFLLWKILEWMENFSFSWEIITYVVCQREENFIDFPCGFPFYRSFLSAPSKFCFITNPARSAAYLNEWNGRWPSNLYGLFTHHILP